MNRFLASADLHAHQYPQFSVPDPVFGNNRLRTIIECLQHMKQYALEYKFTDIFLIGDIFHVRGIINATTFRVVHDCVRDMVKNGLNVHIVAGNHDQANKQGSITSLTGLSNIARVYEHPCRVGNVVLIPYSESREQYLQSFKLITKDVQYVFIHAGVEGAQSSTSEFRPKEELKLEDIPYEDLELVLLGHYHRSQMFNNNVFYVGSLCHNTFEDSGVKKGFWAITEDDVTFVPTQYPEFVTVKFNKLDDLISTQFIPTNYYWVKTTFDIKKSPTWTNMIVTKIETEDAQIAPRVRNIEQMGVEDTIKSFVLYKNPQTDHQKLIDYGVNVMAKVKGIV